MAQVVFHSPPCVVGMSVRDDGVIYRQPRVDVKIALRTKNAFFGKFYEFQNGVLGIILLNDKILE